MKTKLIYISNSILPSKWANSVHVMKMCSAISSQLESVELLSPKVNRDNYNDDYCFNYYGVNNRFTITRLPYFKYIPGRVSAIIYSFLSVMYVLYKKPERVYGRNIISLSLVSFFIKSTGLELHSPPSKFGFFEKFVFKLASRFNKNFRVITISSALKEMVISQTSSLKNRQVHVLHDAADIPQFVDDRIALHGSDEGLNIGYIGHLYKGRGVDVILELARIHNEHNFHIVGGDEDSIKYWKECCRLANVFFYGHVSPKKTEAFRNSFDVLLAPYQKEVSIAGKGNTSDYMSPLKIFEYMSAGKVMISSDIPVLREVLNSENSILVPSDNLNDWSSAIVHLEVKEVRDRLAKRAYDDFLSNYTWDIRANKIIEILSKQ